MSTGLPNTFVSEMALNTAETLLFAATDAGPYVCVLSTGQWYSMATATTPVKVFKAVEFVAAENVVRFATFGRGVLDFKITAQVLPLAYTSFDAKAVGNQQVAIDWVTETERDLAHFEVEKSTDGVVFTTFKTVKANNKASRYEVIDENPILNGVNYYRIKSLEVSGKTALTNVKSVKMEQKGDLIAVFPTVLQNGGPLSINLQSGTPTFQLFDNQGRVVLTQRLTNLSNQLILPNLSSGIYFYSIRESVGNQLVKNGKLMVL